jgi:GNAT superfamily N-acetyltransferase
VDAKNRDIAANFLAAYSWLQREDPALTARPVAGMLCCHVPGELTDFNVALPDPHTPLPEPSSPDFMETLRQVRHVFGDCAFSCWIRRGSRDVPAARDLGFSERADYMGQYLDLKDIVPCSRPDDALTARRVATLGELEAFADLAAAGWSLAAEPYRRFFMSQASRLFAPGCPKQLHIGWVGGVPVCCMELFVQPDSGVAGVYYVATRAACRRQGHAMNMQSRVLEQARRAGFRAAVVVSEPDEQRIMARLGFAAQGLWHEYIQL